METTITRKQTGFRLSESLLKNLRIVADRENRSLNNLVETALSAVVSNYFSEHKELNSATKEALNEIKSGHTAGMLDMSSYESFKKSIDSL